MTVMAIQGFRATTGLQNQQSGSRVYEDQNGNGIEAWSDEHLIDAIVRRGSDRHFRMLIARYKEKVYRMALSVLGPAQRHYADDVAQEVFVKLYQQLDRFRGDSKFSTWLYRLALNAAIDFKRRNKRHMADPLEPEMMIGDSSPDPAAQPDEAENTKIHEAIEALPQSQRMMVYLFYWLEMKINEISEIMACPEGTVKVYLSRARQSLADSLGDLQHG